MPTRKICSIRPEEVSSSRHGAEWSDWSIASRIHFKKFKSEIWGKIYYYFVANAFNSIKTVSSTFFLPYLDWLPEFCWKEPLSEVRFDEKWVYLVERLCHHISDMVWNYHRYFIGCLLKATLRLSPHHRSLPSLKTRSQRLKWMILPPPGTPRLLIILFNSSF